MDVISRKQAMADGLKYYFTGKPCKYGHVGNRYASTGVCAQCKCIYTKKWKQENPDKLLHYQKKWLAKEENQLLKKNSMARWRRKNQTHVNEYQKKWRKENRGLMAMHCREYEVAKIKRVPPWLTKDDRRKIKAMYAEANRLTRETGILMSVDHIIPLRGDLVSGLHVPTNLRIIPFSENASKCNRYEPV